ncbi:hypothetical protein PMM47T1_03149 [Pseudomonas sp. M47T1]|uniref:glycosyltransferase family 39 protein n=1 Tax=unclassified Pseudomonas TaxID=196821 RepID=UPI0002606704|nr:glycosyltransferase family 39 protein [Pseudomonas sp. M47T1]EIK98227.1 hypothetical protein PMM47T1_03149 [Pseudomonas sp. M47T1]
MNAQKDHPLDQLQRLPRHPWLRKRANAPAGLWFWPIMLLATVARLYQLTASAIWCDEGSSLVISQYDPAQIWVHAAHDVHPPLYYLILHGWMSLFGDGMFSIRVISALPGIVSVGLGTWLVHLAAGRRAALLGGVMLALLPIAVHYSQEIRMYPLMGMWLMGATVALVHWAKNPGRTGYLAIYAVLMTASFYTHYFTSLCVLAHWAYLGLLRTGGNRLVQRPAWWLANVAIVVMYLPWVPSLVSLVQHLPELEAGNDVGWIGAVTLGSLPSMVWQYLILSDGFDLPLALFISVPAILAVVLGWVLWTDRSALKLPSLLVIYCVLPLLMIFLISFKTPLLVDRYMMFSALGLPLVLGVAADRLARHSRPLALTAVVAFVALQGVGLQRNYDVDDDQFDKMVDFVNQRYQSGDRIVVSDLFWYFGYLYYNTTGADPLLYTPPNADGSSGRPTDYGFGNLVDEHADDIYVNTLQSLPADHQRVWLISGTGDTDDFASIPSQWHKVDQKVVGDTEARLYERP